MPSWQSLQELRRRNRDLDQDDRTWLGKIAMKKINQPLQCKGPGDSVEVSTSATDNQYIISKVVVISLGLLLAISWVVAYKGSSVVSQAVNLHYLHLPEHPYFQPGNAGLLYVLTPIVVINSLTLFLLPGIFLVLARGKTHRWTEMIIQAFGTSFIVYVVLISMVKLISPVPPDSSTFIVAVASGGALAWAILAYRVFQGTKLPWPISQRQDIRRLVWTVSIPVVVLLVLFPIIFWQDMHDDGFEALEIGRSLSTYFLPRFPQPTGLTGLGNGMIPMAYPVHWFVTLFGPVEASARLPLLLYLPVLFCLLVELIEWRSPPALGLAEEALLCLALGIYTVTMSYNASYDPYFADIASPTAFDTLSVVCMLATINFLWSGQTVWFFFFALMSYLGRPTGFMVLGLLGLAVALTLPEFRKRWLVMIATAMGSFILIAFVYDNIYSPWVIGTANLVYRSSGILNRMRYLRLIEFSRICYGLFPSGILPFVSLLFFRWQDRFARVITIVSLSYFVFFFFQAFVALHHFVPVMILPLVVFWRLYLHHQKWFRRVSLPAVALTSVVAFWLSLPRSFEINRTVRPIGQKTAILVGDYDTDFRTQVKHAELFFNLIPPDWEVEDPAKELVSGYASIIYYSTRPKPPCTEIHYIVQSIGDPKPTGFTKIAADEEAAIYVKDLKEWEGDRFQELCTDYRSPLYDIPNTTLFFYRGIPEGDILIDLRRVAGDTKRFVQRIFSNFTPR